jgi:FAD binding domain
MLIRDLHIRIINAATGELLRELTLDPSRAYQPTGRPPGPTRGPTRKTRRPPLGRAHGHLPGHRARLPVILRAANGHGVRALGSGFPVQFQPRLPPGSLPVGPGLVHTFLLYHSAEIPVLSRDERIALIGDAAHGFPPVLAQGAAMPIEDAVALAESLSRFGDVGQAAQSYESRRWPRTETIRVPSAASRSCEG